MSVHQNDRPRVAAVMDAGLFGQLFGEAGAERVAEAATFEQCYTPDVFPDAVANGLLARTEILITCWGAPALDAGVLKAAPELRAVVHAAGSVKEIVTDALWARGIVISSAAWANARPVAEYTLAAILASNKRILELRDLYAVKRSRWDRDQIPRTVGNQGRTIGIVGASHVGRRVIELLAPFEFEILLFDPYVTAAEAARLGVQPVDLDTLCATADVVTLHAPALPATRHMIDVRRLSLMRDKSTLINTARGMLIDTDALVAELMSGRLYAVIDTTEPEVMPDDSPLYDLPNAVLTPHIAGAAGNELSLLGDAALAELSRYAARAHFAYPVLPSDLDRAA